MAEDREIHHEDTKAGRKANKRTRESGILLRLIVVLRLRIAAFDRTGLLFFVPS